MAQLIDKDAVVAEIERLRKIQPTDEFQPKEQNKIDWLAGKLFTINSLEVFLDTLEVKEVNLEGIVAVEWDDYVRKIGGEPDTAYMLIKREDYIVLAKHFFELGLKAQKGE